MSNDDGEKIEIGDAKGSESNEIAGGGGGEGVPEAAKHGLLKDW